MPQKRNTITLVCTGNTCRSPMAARLLQHALEAEKPPLNQLRVESAGIAALDGTKASNNSLKALEKVELDLSKHRSKMLTQGLIDRSFAIFGMTQSHVQAIQMHFNPTAPYIARMREFNPDAEREIIDPIGMDLQAYEACRDSMVEAIPYILEFLRNEYKPE